ncbi:hypothetical protein OBBRIDRAFT_797436 [Obba rivulosa]|uniref:Shugoshin C-terminal domain-containing protein n=1 Tax=Obba rivulosa TaxID=1052685 RepID=A0A8E2AKC3_9APHY|nr:hypothetical protein OBBRIDRAFT_797436 [Obba rivulosa]
MSRRQSRVSTDIRQNDTLLEFENFKKKFLLANKHITKLNSTLSVRIEELNTQISTLYVENLRLRASEIALASQLKRERDKSRKIMADAEAATHNLMKHLGNIRKSFNMPHGREPTPEPQPPTAVARAKRLAPDPNASPAVARLARPPTVPGIYEDDEANLSSEGELNADVEGEPSPTPKRRKSAKPRLSNSRLPLPTRASSPPPTSSVPDIDFEMHLGKSGKRKPTRRQSGMLSSMSITTVTPAGITTEHLPARPPSPAFGSPLRREVGLAEEEDEIAALRGDFPVDQEEQELDATLFSVARRDKKEKKLKDREREREREKDRAKDRESSKESSSESGRTRERERKRSSREPDSQPSSITAEGSKSRLKDVTNSQSSHIGLPLLDTTSDRERQLTPDNDIPTSASSTRTSSSGRTLLSTPSTTPAPPTKSTEFVHLPTPRSSSPLPQDTPIEVDAFTGRERRVRKSVNYAEPKLNTKMRKPDPVPPPASSSTYTSKRASTSSTEATTRRSSLESSTQPSSSSSNDDGLSTQPLGTVKRKKSRPYVFDDDDESEGVQADAEVGAGRSSGWVNIDGRRRSVHSGSSLRRLEGDDSRRHSMAV